MSHDRPSLYLGIDGGGTRTRAVVAGPDLMPRGRGASGPANAASTPLPRVLESIVEAAEDALTAAGVGIASVTAIACGIAGVEGTATRERLTEGLSKAFGKGRVLVTSDARVALAGASAGHLDEAGIVIIAGTGAIAFGQNGEGLEERAGGWGSLIGDEGSGYWIARLGLSAVLRDADGRGPRTLMRDALFGSEETRSPLALIQKVYRSGWGPGDIAAYFPLVLDAARKGDEIALGILRSAGQELALAAATVARKLGLSTCQVSVATVGGVFSAGELVLSPLREALAKGLPKAVLGPPAHPPEIGAIRLALFREGETA